MGKRRDREMSAWLYLAALAAGFAPMAANAHAAATEGAKKAAEEPGPQEPISATSRPTSNPTPGYRIERLETQGVKLVSTGLVNRYAITVTGSNEDSERARQGLRAGETWRKSLGVDVEGKLGTFVDVNLQTKVTKLERDEDERLFDLVPADGGSGERHGLEEFLVDTTFFADRIAVASSRKVSTFEPLDPDASRASGAADETRFSAWLWRSGTSKLSIDGELKRVDANYLDLSDAKSIDALRARDKETHRLRTSLSLGRTGLFLSRHEQSALTRNDQPEETGLETGLSVRLSDYRDETGGDGSLLALLPDSIWVSADNGALSRNGDVVESSSPVHKSSIGTTRNWSDGSVNFSYWRSDVQSRPVLSEPARWSGKGLDFAGHWDAGSWSLSGNVSWYQAANLAQWTASAEGGVNGSLFLSWQSADWPKLTAGISNFAYQTAFYDYDGTERSSFVRYQLALDCSPWLAAAMDDKLARLTFLASYQGDETHSQWGRDDYGNALGNVFVGFRFARPFLF